MSGFQLETSAQRPRRRGLLILAITFGAFGLWTLLAPLQSAALAPGTVVVKGSRKNVEHLEGGIVAEIVAKDGHDVRAGDLLLRLDDTQARAQLEIAQGRLHAVAARQARLLAERDGAERIEWPAQLLERSAEDPQIQDAMQSQSQLFSARRSAQLGQIDVLRQRIQQLQAQVEGLEATIDGKQKLLHSFTEEADDLRELLEEGFADQLRLREQERNTASTEAEIAQHRADTARLRIQIGSTRLEILQLQKEFHTAVVDELDTTQNELFDLREQVQVSRDRANRTAIVAPTDGVIVGMKMTTIGEVVRPGETLLYVVPQQVELIVEAQVKPVDIDRVHNGQLADIRFSSFKSQTTPVIEGEVISLSADALTPEQPGGRPYYLARVQVSEEGYQLLDELELVPGMPAEVLINTGSRTLFQYLTRPVRDAFARSLIED